MATREKVEFPANIPTIVELDGIGALQASRNGDDEYRYFLRQNRIMWVPPAVHDQIEQQMGNTGDVFEILKSQAKARAPITWTARLTETTRPIHASTNGYSNAPSPTKPNLECTLTEADRQRVVAEADARNSIVRPGAPQRDLRAEAYARDAASYRQPTSQAPNPLHEFGIPRSPAETCSCGRRANAAIPGQTPTCPRCAAQRQPQPAAATAAQAPELPIGPADRMAAALRDAIDLVRGAREYEPSLQWSTADVRAIAATIFIEQSKGARQ
jgi:hypothetical protein